MEVLLTHFAEAPDRSRVIIFTSLRETVFDIVDNLTRRNCPDITAKCFSPRALFLPGQLLCTGGSLAMALDRLPRLRHQGRTK